MLPLEEAVQFQAGESWAEAEAGQRFWRSLSRKVWHGPAVRIPEGYDSRRTPARKAKR